MRPKLTNGKVMAKRCVASFELILVHQSLFQETLMGGDVGKFRGLRCLIVLLLVFQTEYRTPITT